MKRSEINHLIGEALEFFREMNFKLPCWSTWSPEEWKKNKDNCSEIFDTMLGWDLTDFGSGNFYKTGLLLFTLRNGNTGQYKKSYAEKIMIVEENQLTPMHFHWSKTEDIINRGGGRLCIQLFASDEHEDLADQSFEISLDGIRRTLSPGETVCLKPGESITLVPKLYHRFYGQVGSGRVLVGEVSSVNDDHNDNRFRDQTGRFPEIEEDVPPLYLLLGDYSKLI